MDELFKQMNDRFDRIDKRFTALEGRLTAIEHQMSGVLSRLTKKSAPQKWSFSKSRDVNHRTGVIPGNDTISCGIEPSGRRFYYWVGDETFGGLYYDGYARSLKEAEHFLQEWLQRHPEMADQKT